MRSISRQAMPVFHGCSINNRNITFNTKWKYVFQYWQIV
jgi:hypothetical protein